jgi:hypothetical protein
MKILLPFSILLFFASCSSNDNSVTAQRQRKLLAAADSMQIMTELIKELKMEMYDGYMPITKDSSLAAQLYCGFRPEIRIRINKTNQLIIGNDLAMDWSKVSNLTVEFYSANLEKRNSFNDFPYYSVRSKKKIFQEITDNESNLLIPDIDSALYEFFQEEIDRCKTELTTLTSINKDTLFTAQEGARITLEYFPEIDNQASIVDSVLVGFYILRDQSSKRYFNESYVDIYDRYIFTHMRNDREKLQALKVLHPMNVIDHPNLMKYNTVMVGWDYSPVEQLLEP